MAGSLQEIAGALLQLGHCVAPVRHFRQAQTSRGKWKSLRRGMVFRGLMLGHVAQKHVANLAIPSHPTLAAKGNGRHRCVEHAAVMMAMESRQPDKAKMLKNGLAT